MPSAGAGRPAAAFEPSTWAEVEDAINSRKPHLLAHDGVLQEILCFAEHLPTCVDADLCSTSASAHHGTDAISDPRTDARAAGKRARMCAIDRGLLACVSGSKCGPSKRQVTQIEDLLGLGRVDLETQSLVRRYSVSHVPERSSVPLIVPACCDESSSVCPAIDPSSSDFQASQYLQQVHKETSFHEFCVALPRLAETSAALGSLADSRCGTARPTIEVAASAVERIRRSAASGSSAFPFASFSESRALFSNTEEALNIRYRDIIRRQQRVEVLRRALTVVENFRWVFQLPLELRSATLHDAKELEQLARQCVRAREWVHAQESMPVASSRWIRSELDSAQDSFVGMLRSGLSSPLVPSPAQIASSVAALELLDQEDAVASALATRLNRAKMQLRKAGRECVGQGCPAVLSGGSSQPRSPVAQLSDSFVEGLRQFWDLARVIALRRKWSDSIDVMLPSLVSDYVGLARQCLSANGNCSTRDVANDIARVCDVASSDFGVPSTSLGSLQELMHEIVDRYVSIVSRSLKNAAGHLAQEFMCGNLDSDRLPRVCLALIRKAVDDISGVLGRNSSTPSGVVDANALAIATACIRTPELVAVDLQNRLRELVSQDAFESSELLSRSTATKNLGQPEAQRTQFQAETVPDRVARTAIGVAKCCNHFLTEGVYETMADTIRKTVNARGVQRAYHRGLGVLQDVAHEAIRIAGKQLSTELVVSARRLGQYRQANDADPPVSMDVDTASPEAVELVLNLCISSARARGLGAGPRETELLERAMCSETLRDLRDSILEDGGKRCERPAQVWTDIVFVSEFIAAVRLTANAPSIAEDLGRSRDRAAELVRESGFAFGTAEEETLRKKAVQPTLERARVLLQSMRAADTPPDTPQSPWVRGAMMKALKASLDDVN